MYKLAVLDLDGTTLDPRGKVRKATIQTIGKLQQQGFYVSVCTGRNLRNTLPIVKRLGLKSPFLCIDGTAMYTAKGEKIHSHDLSIQELKQTLDVIKEEEVYIEIVAGKNYYKYVKNEQLRKYDFWTEHTLLHRIKKFLSGRMYINELEQIVDQLSEDIYQVIVGGEKKLLEQIKEKIYGQCGSEIEIRDQLWGDYLFIHKKGICKAAGVEKLCEYYNISMDEVVAIGDERNDIDMLEAVGMGIAMGNGVEDVKVIANDITLTNEENGVAHALEHYFLKGVNGEKISK